MDLRLIFLSFVHTTSITGFLNDGVFNVINVQSSVGEILGKLEGLTLDGNKYTVQKFLGIPFAEPPTGDRRYRKPIPKANFTRPFHAFDFGPACLQRNSGNVGISKLQFSEDCLFLNVFAPERANATSDIPVMVWIHGGWFEVGTSASYNAAVLSSFGDVIVVTINYRLGNLGFLRVDEDVGNFGLWDQHLAIKWVKDNIASFGGDVNNITIFGESAGSASVAYQMLYPGNNNLFHRAICQSGSIDSPWGFANNITASKQFDDFSLALGCNGTHDQIVNCLRSKSSTEIQNAIDDADQYSAVIPNRDRDFVPKLPRDMLKPTSDLQQSHDFFHSLDIIMGGTSLEGALYMFVFAHELNTTDTQLVVPKSFYETFLVPKILSDVYDDLDDIPQVVKDITVFQYTDWDNPNDDKERLKMMIDLTTDTAVKAPTVSTIQLHATGGLGNTYLYEFAVRPDIRYFHFPSWMDGPEVAAHGEDVAFLFRLSDERINNLKLNISDSNKRTSKAIMTMWTNFAKTG